VKWGSKFDAFWLHDAKIEFLEGTTAAGKSTVGINKFIFKVLESPKKQHILAGLDTGTIEKNLINKDVGILSEFRAVAEYNGNGTAKEKMPHLIIHSNAGDKIIYVLGYDNEARWKKALGGQYGCLFIDEINIAHIDFVREAVMRADYVLATLNPDTPDLPVYTEFINHSRELPEWQDDTPKEILNALCEEPKKGWVHWFFTFNDNIALSEEKKRQIIESVPKGTKIYKNKILGLRGRATGLVFPLYDPAVHNLTEEQARALVRDKHNKDQEEWFEYFTAGLDTAYSSKSPDVIAMTYGGVTNKGRLVLLEEKGYNNAQLKQPLAPSDTVQNLMDFLERCREKWSGFARHVFIDSADQATIIEAIKYKRSHPECLYIFENAYKKTSNIDRIMMQNGWLNPERPFFYVVDTCKGYIAELNTYSWLEDKDNTPEDGNDHYIQAWQYGWLPFKAKIGVGNGDI